ncbi:hypothetical protein QLR68_27410, partial [Micromonospora sp. DH15]|nr:hypothetical protein [Micromonospora sp. DH15]
MPEAHVPRAQEPAGEAFDPEATAPIVGSGEPVWRPPDTNRSPELVATPASAAPAVPAGSEPAAAAAPPMPGGPGDPPAGPPPGYDPSPARRRRLPLAVLAVLLLFALVGAGLVVVRPGPVAGWLGDGKDISRA